MLMNPATVSKHLYNLFAYNLTMRLINNFIVEFFTAQRHFIVLLFNTYSQFATVDFCSASYFLEITKEQSHQKEDCPVHLFEQKPTR